MTRKVPARAVAPPSPRVAARAAAALLAAVAVLPLAAPAVAATLEERVAVCLACHGANGQSSIPETPSLGGQTTFFAIAQLFLFREGRRNSPVMTAAAKGLTNDDLRAFADVIARLPPPAPPSDPADPARAARGAALTTRHHCVGCHGADFSAKEQVPRLANQREDFLLKAMREFKSGARIGYAGAMAQELVGLSDADLVDLAHYLSHLPPARRP